MKPENGLCRKCGNGLRFVERRRGVDNSGHHVGIYYCPSCDREVIGG